MFLENLSAENSYEFAVLSAGEVAEQLYSLTKKNPARIIGVYDTLSGGTFHHLKISPVEELTGYTGKVVLGTHDNLESRVILLKNLGIPPDRIIVLM